MQKNGTASAFEHRIDALRHSLRNFVTASDARAGKLKNRAIDVKDNVVATSEATVDWVASTIKQHPFAAVGIAFGFGYFAMRMLRK